MVFIFKDYHRKVVVVGSIPMNMLDHVKDWLNNVDIKYTEGVQSLNWAKVMKTITDDPEGFFEGGGWNFLDEGMSDFYVKVFFQYFLHNLNFVGNASEEEMDDDEDSEDEEFQMSGGSDGSEDEESEESDDDYTSEDISDEDDGDGELDSVNQKEQIRKTFQLLF